MFSEKQVPRHIGIIMDGNGRWAQRQGKSRLYGHRQGAKNVQRIVHHAQSLGVPFLTLYAFSIDNNARPKAEVSGLMSLFERYAERLLRTEHDQEVRIRLIGNIDAMKKSTAHALRQLEIKTQDREGMVLTLAVNYSGRDELLRAIHRFQESDQTTSLTCWEDFEIFLDTHGIPDPDLIIRTSGEMRLSHFLPLQSIYSELYFPPVLWPDFSEKDLEEAIELYRKRQRRFGDCKEELSR
jgi:undecaprenyl diphosphate synthase